MFWKRLCSYVNLSIDVVLSVFSRWLYFQMIRPKRVAQNVEEDTMLNDEQEGACKQSFVCRRVGTKSRCHHEGRHPSQNFSTTNRRSKPLRKHPSSSFEARVMHAISLFHTPERFQGPVVTAVTSFSIAALFMHSASRKHTPTGS